MTAVYIISAPSGSGKSTLVNKVRQIVPNLRFSISYTTRSPRGSEQSGRESAYFAPDRGSLGSSLVGQASCLRGLSRTSTLSDATATFNVARAEGGFTFSSGGLVPLSINTITWSYLWNGMLRSAEAALSLC